MGTTLQNSAAVPVVDAPDGDPGTHGAAKSIAI